jgi:hypothetical protein
LGGYWEMKVIWFNHWFTQANEIIRLLRTPISGEQLPIDEIKIIGSHKTLKPSYKSECDLFFQEPEDIQEDEQKYLHWCLAVCMKYKVDIFMPYKHIDIITKYSYRFRDKGITILCMYDYEIFTKLQDKEETYKLIKSIAPEIVPEYYILNKSINLHKFNQKMCIKRAIDVGGKSFRVLVEDYSSKNLDSYIKAELSFKDAYEICDKEKLIIMPYLTETEVSIDCLIGNNKSIAVARYKNSRNKEKIEYLQSGDLYNTVIKIGKELKLQDIPYNVQFIGNKLLEINTRLAGGTSKSSLIGVNIPRMILLKLLNTPIPDFEFIRKADIQKIGQWEIC